MKKYLFTAVAMLMLAGTILASSTASEKSGGELIWLTDLSEAQQLAEEKDLPILVNFTGSDWCKWCIKLSDEVFSQQAFADYADESLILVALDFPRRTSQPQEVKDRNRALATRYGVRGFPTIMLLEAGGSVIAQTGYQQGGAVNYIKHLEGLLP